MHLSFPGLQLSVLLQRLRFAIKVNILQADSVQHVYTQQKSRAVQLYDGRYPPDISAVPADSPAAA